MSNTHFDVLIIGGGITGAGIALDAATRGLKTGLIEMQDFSAGTSSRSTKLIHGGLRYLKQFEFKLVAEVGKERTIVHRNAPHLTHPEKMLLPLIKGGSLGKFTACLAMWIYEFLAGVKKEERFKYLNKQKAIEQEQLLNIKKLRGGIIFYEYRTDDARLTMEVLKTAASKGAQAVNYLRASSFIYDNAKLKGVVAKDVLNGKIYNFTADQIVNAAGPWVDELDALDGNSIPQMLQLTKGVHIVIDHKIFPVKHSLYFDTFDNRMIFVIPREGKTYIGTTDTFYKNEIAHPKVTTEDINYLLKCINEFFPELNLNADHIESCWAGLRPLVKKPGKKPSEISRKDELFISASGLITIAGGKLTGYRKMAQRVVDTIAKKIAVLQNKKIPPCGTAFITLSGGEYNDSLKAAIYNNARQTGIERTKLDQLFRKFGNNTAEIISIYNRIKSDESDNALLIAQLIYCIENEMCVTATDFLVRRTGKMYFNIREARESQTVVLNYMKTFFGWKEVEYEQMKKNLEGGFRESQFGDTVT